MTSDGTAPARVSLAGVRQNPSKGELLTAIREAAEAATDFSWLSRGEAVLVKPVVNSGNPYPATTSPAGVETVVALLKEKGAGRVVVADMAGIEHVKLSPHRLRGSTRKLMTSSGVARAAEQAGAELYFPEEDGWTAFFEDRPVAGSSWKSGIMMPSVLREVEHVVLLPRCSRHPLAGATLGLKAAVGYWRTDSRLEYHHDADTFYEKTAEANTVSSLKEKQRLTLSVADKIQATFGPDKGYVVSPTTGLVFASESILAHDLVSLAWLLESRTAVPQRHKAGFRDPHANPFLVDMINRWVVNLLGGVVRAVRARKLTNWALETVWDDPALRRAAQVFGVPRVAWVEANSAVPEELKMRLEAEIRTSTRQVGAPKTA